MSVVKATVNVTLILNGGLIKLWDGDMASGFGQPDFP